MKRLRNHLIGVDQGSRLLFSDFEDGGQMWTGEGPREARFAAKFSEAFRALPAVHLAFSMWDTDGRTNQRADLKAENITLEGFEIVFRTWGDSRIARVRADWMAIGEIVGEDEWTLY
ncbi:H-type lectin domain-containing protein [Rhodophyticola sp.]|jgi:hypothetical protein|uniref:H-type lectin domain-containing protein n=1 Tax=Rhodophyticola sp. TaxID=2680032 RepID=UPI001B0A0B96|nr:H-type lectin domain-containing protein [Roseicyclus sp.]MBO6623558.1 H-type lectin domain-containing protein [Roseicyclus sp.]MBO6923777.1 H-type lectin domain-containing protein [Roseicyclus sp.]